MKLILIIINLLIMTSCSEREYVKFGSVHTLIDLTVDQKFAVINRLNEIKSKIKETRKNLHSLSGANFKITFIDHRGENAAFKNVLCQKSQGPGKRNYKKCYRDLLFSINETIAYVENHSKKYRKSLILEAIKASLRDSPDEIIVISDMRQNSNNINFEKNRFGPLPLLKTLTSNIKILWVGKNYGDSINMELTNSFWSNALENDIEGWNEDKKRLIKYLKRPKRKKKTKRYNRFDMWFSKNSKRLSTCTGQSIKSLQKSIIPTSLKPLRVKIKNGNKEITNCVLVAIK